MNRRFWLAIHHNPGMRVTLKPTDTVPDEPPAGSLEVYLIWQSYKTQYYFNWVPFFGPSNYPDAIFRNAWPPNFKLPDRDSVVYIHQQPWELVGIPKSWEVPLGKVDELWVPSKFSKDSFIENGMHPDNIFVLPHAVQFDKYSIKVEDKFELFSAKTFKFLFIGGLLPRKGIDVLLKAYREAFTKEDDVSLVIHSIYGDDFALAEIEKMVKDKEGPHVIWMKRPLLQLDVIRLFHSCNVYLSPYRSEGFGLTILEAMASGIPPIVTSYGPALEFVTNESGYFVQGEIKECLVYPCGRNTIFNEMAILQPRWMEPNLDSLKEVMRKAYTEELTRSQKSIEAEKVASRHTWDVIGAEAIKRIKYLVEKKKSKLSSQK